MPTMTPTLWLLLAIIVILALVLLSSWALVWLHHAENTPDSRTADSAAIDRDVHKLRARVPDAPHRPRVKAGAPASYDAQRPRNLHRLPADPVAGLRPVVTHDGSGETVTEWHEPRAPEA